VRVVTRRAEMGQEGGVIVPPLSRSYGTHQLRPAPVCVSPSKKEASNVPHKKDKEVKASGTTTSATRGATGEFARFFVL
jgi:hypothetical protein